MLFLRRNITSILLVCVLAMLVLIWRSLLRIEEDVWYPCGGRGHECRVIVVPP